MAKLDFIILKDLTPQRILFFDASDYGEELPTAPRLHVKFPDFKKLYSTDISFSEINILTTKRLGFADHNLEFQDGIYDFTFETDGGKCEVQKSVYITTQAYKMLDDMLRNATSYNKDLLERYNKINLYLQGAEANVCNELQAKSLYDEALNLLNCSNNGMRMQQRKCTSCS